MLFPVPTAKYLESHSNELLITGENEENHTRNYITVVLIADDPVHVLEKKKNNMEIKIYIPINLLEQTMNYITEATKQEHVGAT